MDLDKFRREEGGEHFGRKGEWHSGYMGDSGCGECDNVDRPQRPYILRIKVL